MRAEKVWGSKDFRRPRRALSHQNDATVKNIERHLDDDDETRSVRDAGPRSKDPRATQAGPPAAQ
jgi:hypothetical protein